MFVFEAPETFQHKVIVAVPQSDGSFSDQDFDATFRIVTQTELDKVIAGAVPNDSDAAIARHFLIGWTRIKNKANEEVPFTHEYRETLIETPYVRRAIAETYIAVLMGLKRKN